MWGKIKNQEGGYLMGVTGIGGPGGYYPMSKIVNKNLKTTQKNEETTPFKGYEGFRGVEDFYQIYESSAKSIKQMRHQAQPLVDLYD